MKALDYVNQNYAGEMKIGDMSGFETYSIISMISLLAVIMIGAGRKKQRRL